MRAYAIRPYSDGRKGGMFFVRRRSGKGWIGGDGLLLFVGKMKIGGFWVQIFLRDRERANQYVRLLFSKETMGAYAIRPYPDGRKGAVFFVRRRSGKGWLGGDGLLLFVGKMKIGGFWVQIFLRDKERANQYVRLLPFDEIMGAYAIRPYPDRRKGGVFFVRRRSGTGWIGEGGLLLSIDIVWKGIRGLRDVGRDRK